MNKDWKEVALDVFAIINPRESLAKGTMAKKIPMNVLGEFKRSLDTFEVESYKGGTKFRNGDTLLARITPCLQNGKTAFVDILEDDEIAFGSTEYIVLREKEHFSHNLFLYYLSISPILRRVAIKSMTGSSGRQRVQNDVLKSSIFHLPPLPEQKAIAHILGTLDDKIELNRKMNETLETMAQALFKSWFVDFDPVLDNALAQGHAIPEALKAKAARRKAVLESGKYKALPKEIQALFPASFVFNEELGKWIPEGWELSSIYDIMNIYYGAPFKSKNFNQEQVGMPIIRIRDLKTGKPQNWSEELHPKRIKIKKGDVLVGMDAEFRPCIWFGAEGFLNQRLFKAESKFDWVSNLFIYHSLQPLLQYEEQAQVGTTVSHLGKKDIDKFKIIKPNRKIFEQFSNYSNSFLSKRNNTFSQIEVLISKRNLLLSQLISGKTRLPKSFIQQFESQTEALSK